MENEAPVHGVAPVAAKRQSMAAHARKCLHINKDQLALETYSHAYNPYPTALSNTPSGSTNTISEETDTPFPFKPPSTRWGSDGPRHTLPSSKERVWAPTLQQEFAQDLCRLFVMCNIAWNVANNVELHLFFAKWVPGAVVPERRALSQTCLPKLAKDGCHIHDDS